MQPWPAATQTQAPGTLQSGEERYLRLSMVATILAIVIVVVNLFFAYSFLHTGSLSPDAIAPLVGVSKLAAPILSILGAIGIFRGWARAFRRLRQQARAYAQTMPWVVAAPLAPQLRSRARFGRVLSVVALLDSGGIALNTTTAKFSVAINYNCSSFPTFGPDDCSFQITNEPESNATFAWQGTSDPFGVSFSPSSGSLAPGEAQTVNVTIPYMRAVTIIFRDTAHLFETDSQITRAPPSFPTPIPVP
jgi:hypothetical protein